MRIGVFGATGLIGSAVAAVLEARGDEVIRFSRVPRGEGWRLSEGELDLEGLEAIINMAGESVGQRWTRSAMARIRDSRIGLTDRIVKALGELPPEERPGILLNGSAVGFYGDRGEEELSEDLGRGVGRLAELCVDWEEAAMSASALGVRVALLRTGIVLGPGAEAWERMLRIFALGVGGRLGRGDQWMPWIHLADEVGGVIHALDRSEMKGPINLVSPGVVRNREWTAALGGALRKPTVLPVPAIALRLVLGEFAHAVLASSRAIPERLKASGYRFRFPTLEGALTDLVDK